MKWWRAWALTAAVALLLPAVQVVPVPWAGAQTEADRGRIEEELRSLRAEVQEASKEEAELLGQIDDSQARKRELDRKVAALDQRIGQIQGDLGAAQARLTELETRQRGGEERLAEANRQLEAVREELRRQAIAAYTGRTDAAQLVEITLHSQSFGELAAKQAYVKAVGSTQGEVVAASERFRNQVVDLRDELEDARRRAEAQRDIVRGQQSQVEAERSAQAAVRGQVEGEIAATNRVKAEVVGRKQEFQAEMAQLQRESEAIAQSLRRRQAAAAAPAPAPATPRAAAPGQPAAPNAGTAAPTAPTARSGSGKLINPLPGSPITSGYGPRAHPIFGDVRMHTGIDISAPEGASIRAAGDGVVVSTDSLGGYGNATVIDHGGSLATLYAHQSSMGVSPGQRVTAGQAIGRVGCTGSCTGPHLHFEVRVNGSPVNPTGYL